MTPTQYDLIVIGGGPAGYEAAAMAASRGCRVMLAERDVLGGTCLNRGCIPTKAFCRSAQVMSDVKAAASVGIENAGVPVASMPAIVERKNGIVSQLRQGVEMLLKGVDVVKGNATFTAPHTVEVVDVGGDVLTLATADAIMIATGSQPAMLPIEGAELAMTSDEMLDVQQVPPSLCIIGGGVIGMEFASIFSELGSQVTVVEYCKEILPPFDTDVAKRLRTAIKSRGVAFATQAQVTGIERGDDGNLVVKYEQKGKPMETVASAVLMAVGRKAVMPKGLEIIGVETGRRGIVVDNQYMTTMPGVYAVGDCNGICQLAHAATAQARSVVQALFPLPGEELPDNGRPVPAAVFTVPECAMVGLTQKQCDEAGLNYVEKKAFYRANGKAQAMGEPDGLVKMLIDAENGRLLGVHILGAHASDLIAEATLAMTDGLPASAIANAIHAHPTLGEIVAAPLM